jgi:hypothetical protein
VTERVLAGRAVDRSRITVGETSGAYVTITGSRPVAASPYPSSTSRVTLNSCSSSSPDRTYSRALEGTT